MWSDSETESEAGSFCPDAPPSRARSYPLLPQLQFDSYEVTHGSHTGTYRAGTRWIWSSGTRELGDLPRMKTEQIVAKLGYVVTADLESAGFATLSDLVSRLGDVSVARDLRLACVNKQEIRGLIGTGAGGGGDRPSKRRRLPSSGTNGYTDDDVLYGKKLLQPLVGTGLPGLLVGRDVRLIHVLYAPLRRSEQGRALVDSVVFGMLMLFMVDWLGEDFTDQALDAVDSGRPHLAVPFIIEAAVERLPFGHRLRETTIDALNRCIGAYGTVERAKWAKVCDRVSPFHVDSNGWPRMPTSSAACGFWCELIDFPDVAVPYGDPVGTVRYSVAKNMADYWLKHKEVDEANDAAGYGLFRRSMSVFKRLYKRVVEVAGPGHRSGELKIFESVRQGGSTVSRMRDQLQRSSDVQRARVIDSATGAPFRKAMATVVFRGEMAAMATALQKLRELPGLPVVALKYDEIVMRPSTPLAITKDELEARLDDGVYRFSVDVHGVFSLESPDPPTKEELASARARAQGRAPRASEHRADRSAVPLRSPSAAQGRALLPSQRGVPPGLHQAVSGPRERRGRGGDREPVLDLCHRAPRQPGAQEGVARKEHRAVVKGRFHHAREARL